MSALEKYANKLEDNAQKIFKHCVRKTNVESLHRLRVDIKKIYALAEMLSYCCTKKGLVDEQTEKVFKRAGKIRQLELMIPLIEKQIHSSENDSQKFLKELKHELKVRIEKFKHRYRHKEKKPLKETNRSIHQCLKSKPEESLEEYFEMMNEKIGRDVHQKFRSENQIHLLRKEIKNFKYNLKLKENAQVKFSNEKYLDKWDKTLGEWHDAVQSAEKLKKLGAHSKPKLQKKLFAVSKIYFSKSERLLKKFRREI